MKKLYKLLLAVPIVLGSTTGYAALRINYSAKPKARYTALEALVEITARKQKTKNPVFARLLAEASILKATYYKDVKSNVPPELEYVAAALGYFRRARLEEDEFAHVDWLRVMHLYSKGQYTFVYFQYEKPIGGGKTEILEAGVPVIPGLHQDPDIQAKKHLINPLELERILLAQDKKLSKLSIENSQIIGGMQSMYPQRPR